MSSVQPNSFAPQSALERLQNRFLIFEAGLLLSLAVGLFAAKLVLDEMGVGVDGRILFAGVVLGALAFVPFRLHLPLSLVRRAKRTFQASPEEIWAVIAPRQTTDFYRPTIRRITQIAQEPPTYRFHLRDLGPPCPHCARFPNPYLDHGTYDSVALEWVENRRLRLVRVRAAALKHEMSRGDEALWIIEPRGEGAEVEFVSTSRNPVLWHWLQAKLGFSDLAGDAVDELAHHFGEASPEESFGAGIESLAAAKSARVYCSCA